MIFISGLIFVLIFLELIVDIAIPDWMSFFWKLHDSCFSLFSFLVLSQIWNSELKGKVQSSFNF